MENVASDAWLDNTLAMLRRTQLSKSARARLEFTAMRAARLPAGRPDAGGSSSAADSLSLEVQVREELSREHMKAQILNQPTAGNVRRNRNAGQHRARDGSRLGSVAATSALQVFDMDAASEDGAGQPSHAEAIRRREGVR